MPNIEIYGLTEQEARKVENQINALLQKKPYASEYVITSVWSVVRDRLGKSQPFLRIRSTNKGIDDIVILDDIINTLKSLHIDIEIPPSFVRFIPAE